VEIGREHLPRASGRQGTPLAGLPLHLDAEGRLQSMSDESRSKVVTVADLARLAVRGTPDYGISLFRPVDKARRYLLDMHLLRPTGNILAIAREPVSECLASAERSQDAPVQKPGDRELETYCGPMPEARARLSGLASFLKAAVELEVLWFKLPAWTRHDTWSIGRDDRSCYFGGPAVSSCEAAEGVSHDVYSALYPLLWSLEHSSPKLDAQVLPEVDFALLVWFQKAIEAVDHIVPPDWSAAKIGEEVEVIEEKLKAERHKTALDARRATMEPICPEWAETKNRFIFREGQVFFDEKHLNVPTGMALDALKRFVERFGEVLYFQELDNNAAKKENRDALRQAIHRLNEVFRGLEVPARIVSSPGTGYQILPQDQAEEAECQQGQEPTPEEDVSPAESVKREDAGNRLKSKRKKTPPSEDD
jgi:DNA-binding winged helix-turn-helix (wHTH) protein